MCFQTMPPADIPCPAATVSIPGDFLEPQVGSAPVAETAEDAAALLAQLLEGGANLVKDESTILPYLNDQDSSIVNGKTA